MQGRLRDVQERNLGLAEEIRAQRRETEEMIDGLEALVADLEAAAAEVPAELRGWVEEAVVGGQR